MEVRGGGDLDKRVAIVTGAGQGIGRGTVLELARAGARLVLADINGQTIERVKDEVAKMRIEGTAL